jgi:hypothetical protein
LGLRPKFAPREKENGKGFSPHACHSFSKEEVRELLEFLHDAKVSSTYYANLVTYITLFLFPKK